MALAARVAAAAVLAREQALRAKEEEMRAYERMQAAALASEEEERLRREEEERLRREEEEEERARCREVKAMKQEEEAVLAFRAKRAKMIENARLDREAKKAAAEAARFERDARNAASIAAAAAKVKAARELAKRKSAQQTLPEQPKLILRSASAATLRENRKSRDVAKLAEEVAFAEAARVKKEREAQIALAKRNKHLAARESKRESEPAVPAFVRKKPEVPIVPLVEAMPVKNWGRNLNKGAGTISYRGTT
jgi:hypothetical protein